MLTNLEIQYIEAYYNGTIGYFTKGHIDKEQFLRTVNHEYGVEKTTAYYCYARWVPGKDEDGCKGMYLHFVDKPNKGVFLCTYTED